MEESHSMKWIIAVAALLIGLGAGFYYGNVRGVKAGVAQEKDVEAARQKAADTEAAKALNPFGQTSSNPFDKAKVNPFDKVKVNPFQ